MNNTCVALSGGVGGAKLALGLQAVLQPGQLQVIVNTGDDFRHLGLPISPDVDTLVYTLTDLANPQTGWGLRDETWQFMEQLERLGGASWFRLGDKDLAMHLRRATLLDSGLSLTEVTAELSRRLGVITRVLPMSDTPAPTQIHTTEGLLEFQDYFVRQQARPTVTGIAYTESAAPSPAVQAALDSDELQAIIVTPSNPWLSVAPILSLRGFRSSILRRTRPVVAVSPIIAGAAVKGPTAKIMQELGMQPNSLAIAEFYTGLIDGLVIDRRDSPQQAAIEALGIPVRLSDTLMNTLEDKTRLAAEVLEFAADLRASAV